MPAHLSVRKKKAWSPQWRGTLAGQVGRIHKSLQSLPVLHITFIFKALTNTIFSNIQLSEAKKNIVRFFRKIVYACHLFLASCGKDKHSNIGTVISKVTSISKQFLVRNHSQSMA